MRPVLYALAVVIGLLGFMFVVGNQGLAMRVVVGVVLIAAAVVMAWLTKLKAPQPTVNITQNIDLPGDTEEERLACKACGAPLDQKSVTMREGAIFVECPYCGTSYQLEEAPKW